MAKRNSKLDKHTEAILKKFKLDPKAALWDCHGTWIIYHRWVVIIGERAGIKLDAPQVLNCDQASRLAAVLVTGHMGDVTAWSFGEAAPYNNKNAYPLAMAEKRAKDRVILELVGLSGHVYTQDDVPDIKAGKPVWEIPKDEQTAPLADVPGLMKQVDGCETAEDLQDVARVIAKASSNGGLNEHQTQALRVRFKARKAALKS